MCTECKDYYYADLIGEFPYCHCDKVECPCSIPCIEEDDYDYDEPYNYPDDFAF